MPRLKIFLSYRREQSRADAGRLRDLLHRELGRASVFIDVDNIPLGRKRKSLRYTVAPSVARPASPVGRPRRAITISAMMLSSAVAIK